MAEAALSDELEGGKRHVVQEVQLGALVIVCGRRNLARKDVAELEAEDVSLHSARERMKRTWYVML